MPTKCLLAYEDEILLGSVVEYLLDQSDELVCSEIISSSQDEVLAAIERVDPDVLVLCRLTHNTIPIQIAPLLMRYPTLLIITVSMDDNYMHIYGKQKVLMQSASDLISVLENV